MKESTDTSVTVKVDIVHTAPLIEVKVLHTVGEISIETERIIGGVTIGDIENQVTDSVDKLWCTRRLRVRDLT